jgi:transcriptional regulator with XRE-family HTH domain
MSYGHADNLARGGPQRGEQIPPADRPETTSEGKPGEDVPVAPDWYVRPELAPMLTGHDIGALYRWLNAAGMSQRRIAALSGTTQPQVADIITGRRARVQAYDVLVRTAQGLSIPRERMGLSFWGQDGRWYGPEGTYPEGATAANTPKGVTAKMLRRHLIAWGGIVMVGAPVPGLGQLLDNLGEPPPVPLPSRLSHAHVAQMHDLRQRLTEAMRDFGADPAMSSAAAARAEQLLTVPGPEPIKQAMLAAVAHLHIHAGIAAFDGGLYQRSLHHLACAVDLAKQAGNPYLQALALGWAGLASIEHGHPDDGLKMLQAEQVTAWHIPPDQGQRVRVQACGLMESATALAMMGESQAAYRQVAAARELWTPAPTDLDGDMDRGPALLEIKRGQLDTAEQFAAASVRRWEGSSENGRTRSAVILATIHVKAGEQRGLQLAHGAITDVTKLTSVRARRLLLPLAEALEARPGSGSDARELARTARQIAA